MKTSKCKTSEIINKINDGSFNFMHDMKLNRKISTSHVNKLTKKILELYEIVKDNAVVPIYVVKRDSKNIDKWYILDGQHRVQSCINIFNNHNIDIEINMVFIDGNELSNEQLIKIISTFNSSSKKLSNLSYVELFSKIRPTGYKQMLEHLKEDDHHKYNVTNLADIYTGSSKGLSLIKKGEKLDFIGGNKRKNQFDEIISVLPSKQYGTKSLKELTNILIKPNYNHGLFVKRIKRFVKRTDLKSNNETEMFSQMKLMV